MNEPGARERMGDSATRWGLVVIDMQNDFVHERGYYGVREGTREEANAEGLRSAALPSVIANVRRAVNHARTCARPIAFVRAVYDRGFPATPPGLRRDPGRTEFPCKPNSWGANFIDPIARLIDSPPALAEEVVIDKHTYDAFHQTFLDAFLRKSDVEHVVFCGIETQVCVFASAAHAAFLGYLTCVLEDAVWSAKDESAAAALEIFHDAYGDVFLTTELIRNSKPE